jgi:hypothetical protein
VIDALRKTKVKLKRDPGELAWMLVVTALTQAIREATDALPQRDHIAPEDLVAFVMLWRSSPAPTSSHPAWPRTPCRTVPLHV